MKTSTPRSVGRAELAAAGRARTKSNGKPVAKSAVVAAKPAAEAPLAAAEDDEALRGYLEGVRAQDQAALGRLYDLTVSRVYGVAIRIVRREDLAEEVVSDVFVQVWRDAHRYDTSRGRVMGWLLIIARSRALDLLRRQDEAFSHPEPYELVAEPAASREDPQDLLQATRAGGALHAAIEQLAPLQRQLVSLAFFRGLSHSEIVEHTGIPLGSVKTHIRRALGAMREALGTDSDLVL